MQLKIGEFAKAGMISVSALRYYDEVGLLKPVEMDPWTGYRYYSLDQLPTLYRILALKDLGLSLDQIRRLMGDELPVEQIRGMLRLKQAELKEQATELAERLNRVETRLLQIEMEGKMPNYEVIVKRVEPVRAAVLYDTVPNMDVVNPTFDKLFDEVLAYVSSNGGAMDGPALDLWYDMPMDTPENMRVAVAAPTHSSLPANDRIKVEELPAVDQMASVVHSGPFATLGQAYGALFTWINDNGYRPAGPTREVYLQYERGGDQNNYVTELQLPVEKA
jgi:DNA-binding transcriptional MerR regulator/predicted transcriptional regulator YdeE